MFIILLVTTTGTIAVTGSRRRRGRLLCVRLHHREWCISIMAVVMFIRKSVAAIVTIEMIPGTGIVVGSNFPVLIINKIKRVVGKSFHGF